ncbi:nitrogen fixation protein FixH [Pontibacter diazotrophicus]|uniref:Nitrogen fixation protein FixH n=1 Tax=Pontibacter diazotrophicus TaxID=1400979 RepID=A0A3D8L866_9BACT|nr:FixH family protein [Pontibacter diazotrophicus]RDV13564.1 nitrogen fixation protein FixH [Pontibacter diazotrophicus]
MTTQSKSFTLWPYAIIAAIVLFMGYIIFFVVQAMNQDVDLVSKDYYEQEIAFQDHIDMVGRTKAVGDVAINYKPENHAILLQLPESFAGQHISGRVNLFRPSDDRLDQEVPLQLGRDLSQLVETEKLEKGLWKVRVNFSAGEETYYTEETIQLK